MSQSSAVSIQLDHSLLRGLAINSDMMLELSELSDVDWDKVVEYPAVVHELTMILLSGITDCAIDSAQLVALMNAIGAAIIVQQTAAQPTE